MQYNDLQALYDSGKSIAEISDMTNITKSSCYRALKLQDTKFRRIGRKSKCDKGKIVKLRKEGNSYRYIGEILGVSHISVMNCLKKKKVAQAR